MSIVIGVAEPIGGRASWGVWEGSAAPMVVWLCTPLFFLLIDLCGRRRNNKCQMSSTNHLVMMNWNVRGMNSSAKRATICEVASSHRVSVLCLQETKIESWSPAIVRELGGSRLQGCAVLPAIGASGGIPILWDKNIVDINTHAVGSFSITAKVTLLSGGPSSFWLTSVYGPVDAARKEEFLSELTHVAPPITEPWVINGDFNTIYEA